jgi:DNA-directed RNA polymerase subunit RPC12/RpoP
MKKYIKWFLHFVSKPETPQKKQSTTLVNKCMSCGTSFDKPTEMNINDFVICTKCNISLISAC